jgi:hypothetical protein
MRRLGAAGPVRSDDSTGLPGFPEGPSQRRHEAVVRCCAAFEDGSSAAAKAERLQREAIELAEATPEPYADAHGRHGLGNALAAQSDNDDARAEWRKALHLHETLGTWERHQLAALAD